MGKTFKDYDEDAGLDRNFEIERERRLRHEKRSKRQVDDQGETPQKEI